MNSVDRYYAAACQLDMPNPKGRNEIGGRVTRMLAMADQAGGEADDPLGDAGEVHQLAREHEQPTACRHEFCQALPLLGGQPRHVAQGHDAVVGENLGGRSRQETKDQDYNGCGSRNRYLVTLKQLDFLRQAE